MESSKEQHLFKIEKFLTLKCFTVIFDQFNTPLLNKSILQTQKLLIKL